MLVTGISQYNGLAIMPGFRLRLSLIIYRSTSGCKQGLGVRIRHLLFPTFVPKCGQRNKGG
jgi:hypothetical protein